MKNLLLNLKKLSDGQFFSFTYFCCLFLIFIAPVFNVIDIVGAQIFYLTVLNILGFVSFNFSFEAAQFSIIFKSKINLFFISFISVCFISIFFAENINESIVKFSYWLNIYFSFILASYFLKNISFKIIAALFFSLTISHLFLILKEYLFIVENVPFSFEYSSYLKGLSGNKNIAASVVLMSYFFIFFIGNSSKNYFIKVLVFVLCFLSFYSILALSSRSVFLATLFILFLSFCYLLFLKIKTRHQFLLNSRFRNFCLFLFLPFFLAYFFFNSLNINATNVNISQRVSTVNVDDQSTSIRLRYYDHALSHIYSNPLIGLGLGNWKFKSIDYDKLNVRQYIVPYHVHNDFLEIFTELGIIGFLSYVSIFLYSFISLLRHIYFSKNHFISLIILMVLSSYFIDSNLNFPHARLIQQLFFIIVLSYISNLKFDSNE